MVWTDVNSGGGRSDTPVWRGLRPMGSPTRWGKQRNTSAVRDATGVAWWEWPLVPNDSPSIACMPWGMATGQLRGSRSFLGIELLGGRRARFVFGRPGGCNGRDDDDRHERDE